MTWSWACEGEKLPGYTTRARSYEAAARSMGAYGIYSAAAHAEWHAVIAGWREEQRPGGGPVLVTRPDLWAAGSAVGQLPGRRPQVNAGAGPLIRQTTTGCVACSA